MDTITIILTSLGGTAATLAVAAFLARSLLAQLFEKEIEKYKADLEYKNSVSIEKIKAELEHSSRVDERVHEYSQIMNRYQGPFQHATFDLQGRIYNIVVQSLVDVYYTAGNKRRRNYVIKNTAFVIAQYFAWAEIIRNEIQFIDFKSSEETKIFSNLQSEVFSLWRTDGFHDSFMIFAGEQRAIGEVMIDATGKRPNCIGYARFLKYVENEDCLVLMQLVTDLENLFKDVSMSKQRLVKIQHALIDMLDFLDGEFIRFPKERRTKI